MNKEFLQFVCTSFSTELPNQWLSEERISTIFLDIIFYWNAEEIFKQGFSTDFSRVFLYQIAKTEQASSTTFLRVILYQIAKEIQFC